MKRLFLAAAFALTATAAHAACNPSDAPPNSIGCQPALPSAVQSTDLLLGWRPSLGKTASRTVTPAQLLQAGLPGAFATLSASGAAALASTLSVGSTVIDAMTVAGGGTFGPSDYRQIEIMPSGTEDFGVGSPQILRVRRVGSDNTAGVTYSNLWVTRSSWVLTGTGAPAGTRFNAVFDTGNSAGADPGAVWGVLSTLSTAASVDSQSAVSTYIQAVRSGAPAGGKVGVPLEAAVIEFRDASGLSTATTGLARTLELDMFVNGSDDLAGGVGREVMPIVLGKANAADASPTITSVIGIYPVTGDGVHIKRGITWAGALNFDQSLFDTRDSVQGTNAAAIWLKDGHKVAFDGTNTGFTGAPNSYLVHGSSALQYWSGGAQQASISDAGLITTVGNLSLTTQSAGIYIGGNPVFRTPAQSLYTATLVGTNAGLNVDPAAIELTAVGHYAGGSGGNTPDGNGGGTGMTGPQNTMIGWFAGTQLVAGQFNTAVGNNSLGHEVSGSNNVAIGTDAMRNSRNNSSNIGIGVNALREADSTAFSIAIGTLALNGQTSSSGSSNIAIGYNAMSNTGRTTAANNVVVGGDIGTAVTSGSTNAFFGYRAGKSFTTGGNNTAVGGLAGTLLDTGAGHTIIGQNAGSKLTGGTNNVIIGQSVASTTLATGSNNIIIGTGSTADTATASTSSTFWVGGGSTAVMSATNIAGTPAVAIPGSLALGAGTLTVSAGSVGLSKITASAAAAGAGGGKIELVCGTNAGTAKLIAYAGTSTTAVTILDNIGSGVTGC